MPTPYLIVRAVAGHIRRFPVEAAVWIAGLGAMAVLDPTGEGQTWCLFARLGIEICPGCGLGHAVALLARGEWAASVASHPLAVPVVLGVSMRVVQLLRDAYAPPSALLARS